MAVELSEGAVASILQDEHPDGPILQCVSIKQVMNANAGNPDRYRAILSDGAHFSQAMLAVQLNPLITQDPPAIDKNTVIRVLNWATNNVGARKIIVVLEFETVAHVNEKIGSPVQWEAGDAAPAPAPARAQGSRAGAGSNASSTSAAKSNAGRGGGGARSSQGGGGGNAPIYPIESLSPYQNKWTIKARVTQKGEIRHWSNNRGDGKLFTVNLLDESGEIRATGFNQAVDNLYHVFEEGKVYLISKARVTIAKKQFSNLSNEYEISFENHTEVHLCEDQDSAPKVQYNFVELGNLQEFEKDATCDVLGIVQGNGELSSITTKATQKQISKRDLTIVDRSGYSCRVTLWGKMAESWTDSDAGVYAFKGAKVGDFGGRTLSIGGQSSMSADPDIPEAHELKGWYDTEGSSLSFISQSSGGGGGAASAGSFKKEEFRTLDRIEIDQLGYNEKADFINTRATIIMIRNENLSYPACPTEKCNKKVVMEGDEQWRCEKCNAVYPAPEYRYIMSMCVADHTAQYWISAFNDQGQTILEATANQMQGWKDDQEDEAYNSVLAKAVGRTWNFALRAKAETYNENTRVKCIIQRLAKVDYKQAAKDLLEAIEAY